MRGVVDAELPVQLGVVTACAATTELEALDAAAGRAAVMPSAHNQFAHPAGRTGHGPEPAATTAATARQSVTIWTQGAVW